MASETQIHRGIYRTLSAAAAIEEYRATILPAFLAGHDTPTFQLWWFRQETTLRDLDGQLLGPCHPDYCEIGFDEWKLLRNIPDVSPDKVYQL